MFRDDRQADVVGARSRASVALVAALACVAATCGPDPQVPSGVSAPPAPFERTPYLQAVAGDSAVVLWRATSEEAGRLRYRLVRPGAEGRPGEPAPVAEAAPGDSGWREAEVETPRRGDRRAALRDLAPDGMVEYSVEEGGTRMGPYRFRTAPADTSVRPIRVLGFGDSGWGSPAQVDLAWLMTRGEWDLAVHVGDIAYDYGSERDFTVRHFRVYASLLARVPFFPVPGNHDMKSPSGEPYDRAFEWPGEEEGRRHYAFRWGRILFLGLDTSTDRALRSLEEPEGEQLRWLRGTLDSLARDTTIGWTVVYMHHPVYSHGAGLNAHGANSALRDRLEPLFLRYGVDLVLMGHEHHYERTVPIRNGKPVPDGCGPVYVITGGGGASRFIRDVSGDHHTGKVSRKHHFVELVVRPRRIEGRAVDRDGGTLDDFTVRPYEPEAASREECAG